MVTNKLKDMELVVILFQDLGIIIMVSQNIGIIRLVTSPNRGWALRLQQ